MPRISNTVPPEMFEAMRERAELARNDGNPDYDPPVLPDIQGVIEGMGGYPQPQWPEDVILPDNKDPMEYPPPADAVQEQPVPIPPPLPDHLPRPEAQPEPDVIETSQADELDGELVAHTTLFDKVDQAVSKIETLYADKAINPETDGVADGIIARPEVEAMTSRIGDSIRDMAQGVGEIGGRFQAAVEAVEHDEIVETQADDVFEAETAPVDASDDSDPYDSEP